MSRYASIDPGVGSQGGDLSQAVRDGVDASGEKAIINVSSRYFTPRKAATLPKQPEKQPWI